MQQNKKKKAAIVFGGEIGIIAKDLLEAFGFEYLELPKSPDNFRKANDYFPEEWCFDIKLMYADLLEAVNRGADIVISLSSGIISVIGPCRLPHIAEHQFEEKLKEFTKKDFKYINIKFIPEIVFYSLMTKLKSLGINMSYPPNYLIFKKTLKFIEEKLKFLNEAKNLMRRKRAKETNKGESYKLFLEFEKRIKNVKNSEEAKKLFKNYCLNIENIKYSEKKVLKIGLVGDFYALFFGFPAFDLENYICNIFDIEILPTYSAYDLYFSKKWKKDEEVNRKLKKYKNYWVGGSDTATIRNYIELMDRMNADGIIQMRTFGCVPEEISSIVIQKINKDAENPPANMILSFDDHSNPEGIKTRIEAFCNTLIRSKNK